MSKWRIQWWRSGTTRKGFLHGYESHKDGSPNTEGYFYCFDDVRKHLAEQFPESMRQAILAAVATVLPYRVHSIEFEVST